MTSSSLFLLAFYLAGFASLMRVRTFPGLLRRTGFCAALIVGLFFLAAGVGGIVAFAFLHLVALIAAGAVAGFVTRAALFGLRARSGGLWRTVAHFVGVAVLPLALVGYGAHKRHLSEKIYAELPTSATLPRISACSPFRQTGPLLSSVIVAPADRKGADFTFPEVPVSYPAVYLEPGPPRFPQPHARTTLLWFEMYIGGARPAPPEDERDADGRYVPISKRPALVNFRFDPRIPVAKVARNALQPRARQADGAAALELSPSDYRGLSAVVGPVPNPSPLDRRNLVGLQHNAVAELVRCGGGLRFCTFSLDESGLTINGTVREENLDQWETIASNVRDFARCAVAAGKR